MSAATGPRCEGTCGKRVSSRRVTRCLYCGRVVCLTCVCPCQKDPVQHPLESDAQFAARKVRWMLLEACHPVARERAQMQRAADTKEQHPAGRADSPKGTA